MKYNEMQWNTMKCNDIVMKYNEIHWNIILFTVYGLAIRLRIKYNEIIMKYNDIRWNSIDTMN